MIIRFIVCIISTFCSSAVFGGNVKLIDKSIVKGLDIEISGLYVMSIAEVDIDIKIQESGINGFSGEVTKPPGDAQHKINIETFADSLQTMGYPFVLSRAASDFVLEIKLGEGLEYFAFRTSSGYFLIWHNGADGFLGSVGKGMGRVWRQTPENKKSGTGKNLLRHSSVDILAEIRKFEKERMR